jgi:ankyrin repeat protein
MVTIHTAIDLAVRAFPEIFDILLTFEADVNHKSLGRQTLLELAISVLQYDITNPSNMLGLSSLLSEDLFSPIIKLLQRGTDPNISNNNSENPLHLAAQWDNTKLYCSC